MKIKGLLLGMLACAAMVACTNEDIVENNNGGQPEKVKGNLSLVISSSSNSSRANSETGDAGDDGIEGESTVTDAIFVLNSLDADGNLQIGEDNEFVFDQSTASLTPETIGRTTFYKTFFKLNKAGKYKILVILNPTNSIKTLAAATRTTTSIYQQILESKYDYSGKEDIEIATSGHFMMVNRNEIIADVKSNNYNDPTVIDDIDVERVVSKITYKPIKENNRYPIEVTTSQKTIDPKTIIDGWYIDPDKGAVHLKGLLPATLTSGNLEIWIYNADGVRRAFKKTGESYDKDGKPMFSLLAPTSEVAEIPDYEFVTVETAGTQTWSVTLKEYALVNLSKSVYTVRHRESAQWNDMQYLGLLDSAHPYMVDPYSANKNASNLEGSISDDFFYNKLETVQGEANNAENFGDDAPSFQDLPLLTDEQNDNFSVVGQRLTYCLENIVNKDKQKPGLVTGIIFRASIGNAEGTEFSNVYYATQSGKYYLTLDALFADNGGTSAAYEVFEGGHCYYYSSDIYHHKGDEYMEKAIMRNNIYVLQVDKFNAIGSATIYVPNSDEEVDNNYYLSMRATILPWVVRFNNIEF